MAIERRDPLEVATHKPDSDVVTYSHDREPQPSDGPDYHEDHRAWERRQRARQTTAENAVARLLDEQYGYLPLHIKYGAARAAAEVVEAWMKRENRWRTR